MHYVYNRFCLYIYKYFCTLICNMNLFVRVNKNF